MFSPNIRKFCLLGFSIWVRVLIKVSAAVQSFFSHQQEQFNLCGYYVQLANGLHSRLYWIKGDRKEQNKLSVQVEINLCNKLLSWAKGLCSGKDFCVKEAFSVQLLLKLILHICVVNRKFWPCFPCFLHPSITDVIPIYQAAAPCFSLFLFNHFKAASFFYSLLVTLRRPFYWLPTLPSHASPHSCFSRLSSTRCSCQAFKPFRRTNTFFVPRNEMFWGAFMHLMVASLLYHLV